MKANLLAGGAMIAVLLGATSALAQDVQAPQPMTGDQGLADIVVTAQRRVESAQKAAIAIDVVAPAELTRAGVNSAATLNAVAPSLNVASGGGATASFFIRGVGNFTNNAYSDSAVAFNYDGVYIGRPTATNGAFFDLERIEVLKGPQGTLYGRNATGGAINVLPSKPKIGELGGAISIGIGNYDNVEAEAAINLPVGDNSAFRVAGKVLHSDGYNDDGTADSKAQGVRAQFLTEPSDGVSLRLAADYSHVGGMGPGGSYQGSLAFVPGAPASSAAPANYVFIPSNLDRRSGLTSPEARDYFSQLVIGGSFNFPAPVERPYINDTNWGVTGELGVETGIGDLTVISAYRRSRLDDLFNGPGFRGGRVDERDRQFSAEVRLNGKRIGPVEWLLGAYYFDETTRGRSVFNQYIATSIQSYDVGTRSTAGFGRLTFHLADSFRLVAAGRYTHDRKSLDGSAPTLLNICTNAAPPLGPGCLAGPSVPVGRSLAEIAAAIPASDLPLGFPVAPGPANARPFGSAGNILFYSPIVVNDTVTQNRFTYRLAAEFDAGPNSLAYASYETGYRSGGFSLSLGHETFEPEYIKAATVGLKNRFFNNRLQLNIEAFYWRYSGQQVSHFGLDGLGLNSYFTENAGRSTIKGVDVDVQFRATPSTLLSGSIQYLENKLDDYSYQTPRGATFLPPAVGCPYAPGTNALGQTVYDVDCSGKPGFNSPKWSASAGIEQYVDAGPNRITFAAQGRYRSNRVVGFDYLPQSYSGRDFVVDGSISFGDPDETWAITLWGRNLTNRTVPTITQLNSSVANTIITNYAPPRTYGIRGNFRF
ncbi:hypothetical protein L288_00970 [Sphingobium quisquiliarum P25]|uniref:TonB-denpendent receptor n=2 Tax=Sphingobium quisquiliarum TaxID=538379 RepID=T0HEH1_9SPHN|nr:hypothetical protein L288_00970 [Sphingobium quisquiliarum P25]